MADELSDIPGTLARESLRILRSKDATDHAKVTALQTLSSLKGTNGAQDAASASTAVIEARAIEILTRRLEAVETLIQLHRRLKEESCSSTSGTTET